MSKRDSTNKMTALTFELKIGKLIKSYFRGKRKTSGYWKKGGPVSLKNVPIPSLVDDDWVIIKTIYSGICGSDMKELTLNGARDNPLQSFISFPHIMGHEPIGIVHQVGIKVRNFKIGDRVVISPWFPCEARGIIPKCSRCQQGDYKHCHNFKQGDLPVGMHLGVTKGFGGFAHYIAVHKTQCFIIPPEVSNEQAVLADPFSVAFHSILILEPNINSTILVFGIGVIGLLTVMCLKQIFKVKHVIAVGRYEFQNKIALRLGADHVFLATGEQLVKEIAKYMEAELYTPDKGLQWTLDGVDGIIDTIASSGTLEFGIRLLTTQGRLVFLGVSTPKRFENTPHYFKELEIIGSNAFSIEEFENKRAHAFVFFLKFLSEKRIDTSILITHKYPLEKYKKAFDTLTTKSTSHAIKVVFDFTDNLV
ncbi:hypothetical protein LCGC14_0840870 [marine sediment metagenome]|uniref:Enoyl reductase (ER) domain-containing protein n=1 Tax=marine sediment metagenome TaxID=412755 RepID=A0A0F9SKI0_9ZZZZ